MQDEVVVGMQLHQGILQGKEGPCNCGREVEVQPDVLHNDKEDKEAACADEQMVDVVGGRHKGRHNEEDNADEGSCQVEAAVARGILGDAHKGRAAHHLEEHCSKASLEEHDLLVAR